jgi:hypothetical protein
MREQRFVHSWSGRVLLVAMVVMAGAVGFCLFAVHGHGATDHGMSPDLCAGLAILSVAIALVVCAQLNPMPIDPPYVGYAVPLHLLDHPPKSPSLS